MLLTYVHICSACLLSFISVSDLVSKNKGRERGLQCKDKASVRERRMIFWGDDILGNVGCCNWHVSVKRVVLPSAHIAALGVECVLCFPYAVKRDYGTTAVPEGSVGIAAGRSSAGDQETSK